MPEGRKQKELERAIRGRGAFRRFKDLLYDFDLEEEWFQYGRRSIGRWPLNGARIMGLNTRNEKNRATVRLWIKITENFMPSVYHGEKDEMVLTFQTC